MPLSLDVYAQINTLDASYRQRKNHWFGAWFYPKRIATALIAYGIASTVEEKERAVVNIFFAYLNGWQVFRRWISELHTFAHSPHMLLLMELHRYGLLHGKQGRVICTAVLTHPDLSLISHIFSSLQQTHLLIGEPGQFYTEQVLSHRNPWLILMALNTLNRANLLKGELGVFHWTAVMAHSDPFLASSALNQLKLANLLREEEGRVIAKKVLAHVEPGLIAHGLSLLKKMNLLNGECGKANMRDVFALSFPNLGVSALNVLYEAKLLEQARFNLLIEFKEILSSERLGAVWIHIPTHQFRAWHFEQMIAYCRDESLSVKARENSIAQYIYREFIIPEVRPKEADSINPAQSTHITSVHQSASESAQRLKLHYGAKIHDEDRLLVLEQRVKMMKSRVVGNIEQQRMSDVAIRCLERMAAMEYQFIDPMSKVSIRELLAMSALAIQDEEALSTMGASAEDAFWALIQGLYEIQRGYNLNEHGVDNEDGQDHFICMAGTFNKLINSLQGFHPDCVITLQSKAIALAKLPRIIIEQATLFLNAEKQRMMPEAFNALMVRVKAEHLTPIWTEIKTLVHTQIEMEFHSLLREDDIDAAAESMILNLGENPHAFFVPHLLQLKEIPCKMKGGIFRFSPP